MGMYDDLRVEYPLPDAFDPGARLFQTKDTPHQWLELYVLQTDGRIIHERTRFLWEPQGAFRFYTSNIAGTGPQGCYTDDDQPTWHAAYVALYDHGTLLKLEGGKRMDTTWPRLTRAAFFGREEA